MPQYVVRYRKRGPLRWISHLDLKRTLEYAMRRAQLPLELTQGHNPHPKLSFGPPLSLGVTGEGELLAVHLTEAWIPDRLAAELGAQLPPGLDVLEAWVVPGYKKKETFGDLDIAEYRVTIEDALSAEDLRNRIHELLSRTEAIVERGGDRPERSVDVRPMLLSLKAEERGPGQVEMSMRLRTGSHGGARPQEVLSLLGIDAADGLVRIDRVGLYVGGEAPTPAPQSAASPRRRWGRSRWVK